MGQPARRTADVDQEFLTACRSVVAPVLERAAQDMGVVDEARHLWAISSPIPPSQKGRAGHPATT
ncbi:hypothetical protein [Azospirillum argentinense]|uniref:Uncharacterized protein n=1 Tax=Azospirillum brasilense TaxID=192 RepID=A0A4D8QPV6_AZOBR|nr:hypothetical protein [Azospirillum argentinense]QCO07332.1 hypothetical protein D3867_36235 [Azospirillum argentinense]